MAQTVQRGLPQAVRVHVAGYGGVISARGAARAMAVGLGFTLPDVTRITTAVAEVARNIARFAWSGVVVLKAEHRDGAPAIVVEAIDGGPGMPDVEMGTAHEFGTGAGSGLGLSTARRLMDYLSIASQAGVGTTVTMRKDA